MTAATDSIITVNTGSSSIKLSVFVQNQDSSALSCLLDISIDSISQSRSLLEVAQPDSPKKTEETSAPDYLAASRIILEKLADLVPAENIKAIGHRLVHGGTLYTGPTPVTAITNVHWDLLSRLDPAHTPFARQLILQFQQHYPSVPQIACFDTAFFHSLPDVAKIIPIPQKYSAIGVRRYGFHGLSYTSLLDTFKKQAGDTAVNGRIILAHLGSGASLTATKQGRPIDTTMGFTPTSGIVMSTRSGDLDPNIFSFLHQQTHMSLDEFNHMVSFKSGLLGVSDLSGEMHTLLAHEDTNKDVATAIELFVYEVKKAIGALAATLGGLDSLIFSGGIGERSAILRRRICHDLGHLGIAIDDTANEQQAFLISANHSNVGVHVIPTDEAQVIATQTIESLKG